MIKSSELDGLPVRESDPGKVDIAVEVLKPSGSGYNYVVTKRYKTRREIYREVHKLMNLRVCSCGHEWEPRGKYQSDEWDKPCPKCGGSEIHSLIDEYDSECAFTDEEKDKVIAPREWQRYTIACYCEVGGNEGYMADVSVIFYRNREPAIAEHIYHVKSFRGMDHVHDLVKRLMKIFDVWRN